MYYIPLQQPLDPAFMDGLLAMGWYRMSQHVFTTRYVHLSETEVFEVLWARVALGRWTPGSRHLKLLKQNRRFRFSLMPATLNAETEELYARYRASIDFESSASAQAYLQDQQPHNFFPTRMWQVRDGNRLVGASYFDEGLSSAAGILTFFHPDYRKYSLGLLLYLESVRHAAQSGKEYFYPGYIALENPKFDYKLQAGKEYIEIWQPDQMNWIPYASCAHARQDPAEAGHGKSASDWQESA
ncbi:MAG: GNAT family N-acetyltransferase [Chitinophagaceae bacterium]|jgi:arginine-tRNA-protein transferase|nr:GNAT family N-acetyltransferase [Chitinophagaceae bacterium]